MFFHVYTGTGKILISTTTYSVAREEWGAYLETKPVPSVIGGIASSTSLASDEWDLDIELLDRWTRYGSPEQREPTVDELEEAAL